MKLRSLSRIASAIAGVLLLSSAVPANVTEAATSVACTNKGVFQDDNPSKPHPDVNFVYLNTASNASDAGWVHNNLPGAVYDTSSYSNSPYAAMGTINYVKFTVNCVSGFDFYYEKAYNHGYAEVYANGALVATVDQYSPTVEYQKYTYIPLPPGIVEVSIYGSPYLHPGATDYYFNIDGIIPR